MYFGNYSDLVGHRIGIEMMNSDSIHRSFDFFGVGWFPDRIEIECRTYYYLMLSIVAIGIISRLVTILICSTIVWIILTILIRRAIMLLSIVITIVLRLLSYPIVAIFRGRISVVDGPLRCRLFGMATTIIRGRPSPLFGLLAAMVWFEESTSLLLFYSAEPSMAR